MFESPTQTTAISARTAHATRAARRVYMVLARADPRRRAWAVPCFALPRRGLARARPRRVLATARPGRDALPSYARRRRAGRWGRHGGDTNLQHYRSVRVCERPEHRRAQSLGRRRAPGPRRQEPGLNDRQARAKHLAALPARAAPRGPRGSPRIVTARASTRRCPPLDARATQELPAAASSKHSKLCSPLGAAPRPPWSRRSSTTGSRPTSTC